MVRQTFSLHTGWRAPLVGRFFRGEVKLKEVKQQVNSLELPERVRFEQIPRWWFDKKFERRFLGVMLIFLLVLQLGVIIYGVFFHTKESPSSGTDRRCPCLGLGLIWLVVLQVGVIITASSTPDGTKAL